VERLGLVYRDQENYPAAVETFRKMLTLAMRMPSAVTRTLSTPTANQTMAAGNRDGARSGAEVANDREVRMVLDAQLADTGEPDKALADVRSMLNGKPEDREIYITLAQMNTRLKRWNDAEEALSKANLCPPALRQGICLFPARLNLRTREEVRRS